MHLKKELIVEDVTTNLLKLSTPANMVIGNDSRKLMLSVVGYLPTFSYSHVLMSFFIYLVVLVILTTLLTTTITILQYKQKDR